MASRLVGSTESSATASGTATAVVPTGPATGVVMLAILYLEGGTGTVVTPPGGWTSELRVDDGVAQGIEVFSRVFGTFSASYDFALSANVDWWAHGLLVRGQDQLDSVDGVAGQANASDTSFPASSIPVTTDNTLLIGAWMGA